MAVESIRTPVQVRDMAGDQLLVPPRKVPFGEMDGVRKLDHLTQEIWARAKTFNDSGDLCSPRARPPEIVRGRNSTFCLGILDNGDLRRLRFRLRYLRLRRRWCLCL